MAASSSRWCPWCPDAPPASNFMAAMYRLTRGCQPAVCVANGGPERRVTSRSSWPRAGLEATASFRLGVSSNLVSSRRKPEKGGDSSCCRMTRVGMHWSASPAPTNKLKSARGSDGGTEPPSRTKCVTTTSASLGRVGGVRSRSRILAMARTT
eukprot:scaffold8224_cov118-Isochrysis_galbana.AAC.11